MTAESQPTPEDVGQVYDQFTDLLSAAFGDNVHAGYWDDGQDQSPAGQAADRLTDLVTGRLRLEPQQAVLDVGCGSGRVAVRLAEQHAVHVTGITISAHQLRLAQARPEAGDVGSAVSFQYADAMQLPFADASFDAAYAIESLLHMSDQRAVLAHLARVLRPGGRLVIADLCRTGPLSGEAAQVVAAVCEWFQIASINTADEYRERLHTAGFEVEGLTDIAEHVIRRSFAVVGTAMRQAAGSADDELTAQLTGWARLVGRFSTLDQIGYVVLSAVRA
ncbi:SAM-dependent methyltransferase [Streptomyces olivoreticuli]